MGNPEVIEGSALVCNSVRTKKLLNWSNRCVGGSYELADLIDATHEIFPLGTPNT